MPSDEAPPTATAREAERVAREEADTLYWNPCGSQSSSDRILDAYAASIRATEREAAGEREEAAYRRGLEMGRTIWAKKSAITNATEGT